MPDDSLTLTIRLHDPKEKQNVTLSATWATVKVPRADLELPQAEFVAKYITPNLSQLVQLKLK